MGRLRFCCLVLILASIAVAFQLRARPGHGLATVALLAGTALLAIVTPIPAYHLPTRRWVFRACAAYTLAGAAAFLAALASHRDPPGLSIGLLTAAGALLTWWAHKTHTRRRVHGLSAYFKEG